MLSENEKEIRRNPPNVLSVVETAIYLGVSDRTVRKLVYDNELPHRRVRNQIRINLSDLQKYMEAHSE